ncbi:ornithine--oxo-acid transaminase [Bradyrhizobium sp. NFR13]|uniref:ornithine--oxo-acid transaminase n=1 Tax=Bradyrhizobium sp. NFR13 TaxID=1566285 RepID=UPI0008F088D3|nr:ornithine--oxo-acid transaminase [Bradyrhizobium sp. NFR13]SFM10044.1 ornithine--oxo-acid transaminase [Bradyrhizobium sp. NFR13]
MTDFAGLEARFGAGNYAPLPVTIVRGAGVYVWDEAGRRYIDMMGAYSAASFGHCHPRLVKALTEQAQRLDTISRAYFSDRLGPFLAKACALTDMDAALPMNSGAEAVETALKAARKWAYKVKGVPTDRAGIIAAEGNFHGRTISIVGFSSQAQYRDGFGPFPPGFTCVPFGDASALAAAITPDTAAFLVEPIQGEGGINVPPPGYLAEAARICKANNVLLLCDEIQSGLGRTGRLLACQYEGVTPDGLMLGKALGGGMLPVSLFLARREVMQVFTPGDHGSTFGGNPIASAVGLAALDTLIDERLIERAATVGAHLLDRLSAIKNPIIREVRGRGLFAGVELHRNMASAGTVISRLLQAGVLTKDTHRNTIRFAPPLIIDKSQVDWAVDRLAEVLDEIAASTVQA